MSLQIPNLHTSNRTKGLAEKAVVTISTRKGGGRSGTFVVNGVLSFDPVADAYPTSSGPLTIQVDLTESAHGVFVVTTVEQLDTTGRSTPTLYATGRCNADTDDRNAVGCRYWLMWVDNRGRQREGEAPTPDVISFLVFNRLGKRVAYGTGPLSSGDVKVAPTSE